MNLEELITSFMICYLGIMKNIFFCLEPCKLNLEEIYARRNNLLAMRIDDLKNSIIPKIYDFTNVLNNSESFDSIFYQPVYLSNNSIQKDRVYLFGNGIFLNFLFWGAEENQEKIKVFFLEGMNLENFGTY